MDGPALLGYLTGLYFIKPDMEIATLIPTAALVHLLDALLCRLIASNQGRHRTFWTAAGSVSGIWALGVLCLLADKRGRPSETKRP